MNCLSCVCDVSALRIVRGGNCKIEAKIVLSYIPVPGEGLDLTSTPKGFQCPPK